MIGVISSQESELGRRVVRTFGEILLEGLLDCGELIPYAVIVYLFVLCVYLVGSMVYHLMYDPNSVDVASRLDALSIDPERWIRRS
jgi:hypothetical protein